MWIKRWKRHVPIDKQRTAGHSINVWRFNGSPKCGRLGAINGTNIKYETPAESGPDYFSGLQRHDVVIQAVADAEKRFLDVAAGFPWSMHDSQWMLRKWLWELKGGGGGNAPLLLGGSAYPLSDVVQCWNRTERERMTRRKSTSIKSFHVLAGNSEVCIRLTKGALENFPKTAW